jgi:hypothetical protein
MDVKHKIQIEATKSKLKLQNAKLNGHFCCDFTEMVNLMAANIWGFTLFDNLGQCMP